jgi:hypothetical protein
MADMVSSPRSRRIDDRRLLPLKRFLVMDRVCDDFLDDIKLDIELVSATVAEARRRRRL